MERRPPRSTLNDTLLPYTTLFRSEQRAQLHLAEGAAGLDVAEHALEVADADRQLLHLAQAALHRFQALGDELERRVQAGVERGLQLFIDGGAHLFELRCVVGLQLLQLRLERGAHLADALLVALGQLGQALAEGVGEALLQVGAFGARLAGVLGQRLAQHVQALVGAGAELGQARAEAVDALRLRGRRSEEHTSELPSLMRISYAVFCLKKQKKHTRY